MDGMSEQDRAVLARIGGRMITSGRIPSVGWTAETWADAARIVMTRVVWHGGIASLPEAAFDWPIYRAARMTLGDRYRARHRDPRMAGWEPD